MKKIGLLTFHESDNFGTCLQAFALQHTLKKISGCQVELLRYYRSNVVRKSKFNKLQELLRLLFQWNFISIFWIIFGRKKIQRLKKRFREYREKYYSYSAVTYREYQNFCEHEDDYDAYVVGSDMVWSQDRATPLSLYFLKFAQTYKKIAYAPSIGSLHIAEDLLPEYKKWLSDFPYISCREKSGCDLIFDLTGRKVPLVADPTLLISAEEWNDIFRLEKSYKAPESTLTLLSYLFDGVPKGSRKTLEDFCKANHMSQTIIPMSPYEHFYSKNELLDPTEFVDLIRKSSLVLTNSYHGLVFSIIYRKPFCVLARPANAHWVQFEERLTGLLRYLHLENRRISNISELTTAHLTLDYSTIEPLLLDFIASSTEFLRSSLRDSEGSK
ncbi:polysaccharide pyruvyl transferase family protein [Victivallis sp. Marseille-Q1083]|uniref:polysaccharide pyruvyl transferase family protein n=1 Tax=Victivallis sp. Marseille-Q1083 TaxID=2717288 RepID=UPI0015883333|nr:polysaccharide pyruvyl transferase family protein [Victivallis sp. Marseille-Q1083]